MTAPKHTEWEPIVAGLLVYTPLTVGDAAAALAAAHGIPARKARSICLATMLRMAERGDIFRRRKYGANRVEYCAQPFPDPPGVRVAQIKSQWCDAGNTNFVSLPREPWA
jgi:hypothetical protein